MDLKIFVDTLSEKEFLELENLVKEKRIILDGKRAKLIDFINKNRHNMSNRLKNGLIYYSDHYEYLDELNRNKFSNVPAMGHKTLTELEYLLKECNVEIADFLKGYNNVSSLFHKGVGFYR